MTITHTILLRVILQHAHTEVNDKSDNTTKTKPDTTTTKNTTTHTMYHNNIDNMAITKAITRTSTNTYTYNEDNTMSK